MDASNAAPPQWTDAHAADLRRVWLARLACVIVPIVIWFAPLPLAPSTQHRHRHRRLLSFHNLWYSFSVALA